MSSNEHDISHLFKYSENICFVSAAYQELLARPIGPEELCYAVQMLKNGLSRKGFIYWISRSPEFNHRFPIKDLKSYIFACYFYKGLEKIFHLLHLDKTKSIQLQISSPVSTACSAGYAFPSPNTHIDFGTEFNALSTGQISQLSKAFPTDIPQTQWHTVGYLASEFLEPHQIESSCLPDNFSLSQYQDNLLLTSPEIIYRLFVENQLGNLSYHINDTFLFTMPKLPAASNGLSVIWDNNWSETKTTGPESLSRWLKTSSNCGNIWIINQTASYKKISVHFSLLSYHIGATIMIKCGSFETSLNLSNTDCPVVVDMWLNPGYNYLSFIYMGLYDDCDSNLAFPVKFAINNLTIPEISCSDLYSLDETKLGSGYFPYILSDSFIRTALHRNGFFEVKAISVSSTYSIQKLETTRYDYQKDELGKNCYYIFDGKDCTQNMYEFPSIVIYTARRTSSFHPESFVFPKN